MSAARWSARMPATWMRSSRSSHSCAHLSFHRHCPQCCTRADSVSRGLADERPFITGDDYTVADIMLYAYVHCAGDAGVDPREHAMIGGWLDRVEATPGFENDLEPFPPHARVDA